jgi:hypothetical protein
VLKEIACRKVLYQSQKVVYNALNQSYIGEQYADTCDYSEHLSHACSSLADPKAWIPGFAIGADDCALDFTFLDSSDRELLC